MGSETLPLTALCAPFVVAILTAGLGVGISRVVGLDAAKRIDKVMDDWLQRISAVTGEPSQKFQGNPVANATHLKQIVSWVGEVGSLVTGVAGFLASMFLLLNDADGGYVLVGEAIIGMLLAIYVVVAAVSAGPQETPDEANEDLFSWKASFSRRQQGLVALNLLTIVAIFVSQQLQGGDAGKREPVPSTQSPALSTRPPASPAEKN